MGTLQSLKMPQETGLGVMSDGGLSCVAWLGELGHQGHLHVFPVRKNIYKQWVLHI